MVKRDGVIFEKDKEEALNLSDGYSLPIEW